MNLGQTRKKHIHTSKAEKWQRLDKLVKWIPLAYPLVMFALLLLGTSKDLFAAGVMPLDFVWLLVVYVLMNTVISVPLMFICRAVSKTAKKAARQNATFKVTEDFDYYRENLSDISPTTISLLVDLQIEPAKDIAATILHLTLIGVLSPDGAIIDRNVRGLNESDRILLDALEQDHLSKHDLNKWKNAVMSETLQSGYIERKQPKSAGRGCLFGILQFIGLLVLIYCIGVYSPLTGWIDSLIEQLEAIPEVAQGNSAENLQYILIEPLFMMQVIFTIVLMGLLIMYWVALPIITIIRTITAGTHEMPYNRTPEGEVLTERIAGIKNFLRDFSNLSQAQKAQLILWDDFLVYAVVLEENRLIVNELLHMKGLTYREITFT